MIQDPVYFLCGWFATALLLLLWAMVCEIVTTEVKAWLRNRKQFRRRAVGTASVIPVSSGRDGGAFGHLRWPPFFGAPWGRT